MKILTLTAIFLLASISAAQTKPVSEAQQKIAGFANPERFEISYERDLTRVAVKLDVRTSNKNIRKSFKEFTFRLESTYVGNGIEKKPFLSQLCINTLAKRFMFASDQSIAGKAGTKEFKLEYGERKTSFRKRKPREQLCWEADRELLLLMSDSAPLVFSIGSSLFTLSDDQAESIAGYLDLVTVESPKTEKAPPKQDN